MSLLNFTKLCAAFAVAAGVLEVIGSLRLFDATSLATELHYIATDLCLLLGFLLAFLATGFIAGPSTNILGMPAYTLERFQEKWSRFSVRKRVKTNT